jgi:hypothetical protein
MLSSGPAKPASKACNPGIGVTARVAFSNGEKSWTEEIDVVDAAARALTQCGHSVSSHGKWLEHRDTGFVIQPQFVELQPFDNGGVRTTTTIECRHTNLVPDGIFEYQHATGDNPYDSIHAGFEQWAKLDFVPLLEALREKPEQCMTLQMSFPPKGASPELNRRAVLGPVSHIFYRPPAQATHESGIEKEQHPFCPCCLLTNSFEAFKSHLESDRFCGIRLYAARHGDGVPQADCRVNGEDWEPGKRALRDYVATWPQRGFEVRKQYVVLQTLIPPAALVDAG